MNKEKAVEKTREFWSDSFIAKLYRKRVVKKFLKMHAAIGTKLASYKSKQILDVACGSGDFLSYLNKQIPEAKLAGTDIALGMVKYAQKKLDGIAIIQESAAESQPFPSEKFDAITITMAFHHFPDKEKVLLEMKRLLRPGGVLIISDVVAKTNFGKFLWNILERIISVRGFVDHYTENDIRNLSQKTKLEFQIANIPDVASRYRMCVFKNI